MEIAGALLVLAVALLMLVPGFVFLAWGLFCTALGWRMRGRARGTIIGTKAGDDGETLPIVTFTTAQGTPVRVVAADGVGSTRSVRQVPVRYNERDPTDARIATFGRSYLNPLFSVALGAMPLGLFVFAIFTL